MFTTLVLYFTSFTSQLVPPPAGNSEPLPVADESVRVFQNLPSTTTTTFILVVKENHRSVGFLDLTDTR